MFRFRLEKVLRHRRRLVDAAARDVAAATAVVHAAQARVADSAERIADFIDTAARARLTDLDPQRLTAEGGFRDVLEAQRLRLENDLVVATARLEAVRAQLVEAHRGQQILERLEEKQRQAWELEQVHLERRQLDEVGSIRAAAAGRQDKPDPRV
jgi:flagellar export protein FliJ